MKYIFSPATYSLKLESSGAKVTNPLDTPWAGSGQQNAVKINTVIAHPVPLRHITNKALYP